MSEWPGPVQDPFIDPGSVSGGLDPADLAERVAFWRAREEAFLNNGPAELRALTREPVPPQKLPQGVHQALEPWYPFSLLRRELSVVLAAFFGPERARDARELSRARSWIDARRRLRCVREHLDPSSLLASLAEGRRAWILLCEAAAPLALGSALGRYADRLRDLSARVAARDQVRAWDVGTATGEGTFELAAALHAAGVKQVEVIGTDASWLLTEMASRGMRPHDPAAERALLEFAASHIPPRSSQGPPVLVRGEWVQQPKEPDPVRLGFLVHDVREGPVATDLDLITCHGLLGEGLSSRADVEAALRSLAAGLRGGGLLSIADRFRQDRARAAREWIAELAPALGLAPVADGIWTF